MRVFVARLLRVHTLSPMTHYDSKVLLCQPDGFRLDMMSVDADGIVHTLFEETRGHCWAASRHVQTSPLSPSPPAPLHFFLFMAIDDALIGHT